jgi:uncharacterized protein
MRFNQHSWLFHRNRFIAWSSTLLFFAASALTPNTVWKLVWFVPAIFLQFLIWRTFWTVHPRRVWIFNQKYVRKYVQYEVVNFESRDGVALAGWYSPGTNRKAVILVHGLGASKAALLEHAVPFKTAGFGILMIDLRAHGESGGDICNFGTMEALDVLGGIDYLIACPDVDHDKIGAVGISIGAQAVLRAAVRTHTIRAIILDGLGPAILDDHGGRPTTLRRWINYPLNWFMYRLGDFMRNEVETVGVLDIIRRIAPRPLMLISTGTRAERYFNRLFFDRAANPKKLWEIESARHAAGLYFEPQEYPAKMIQFFDKALS